MATVPLADALARETALSAHDRSLLVEAGAGSGKTAVLAGRIALMLLRGIEPTSIAAVTFTELAASELLQRVRSFVARLLANDVPRELRQVLPDTLSDVQIGVLQQAQARIDDITCSTIHGFCQRLIRPYPVEASIDPGASIMDRDQATLAFQEVVDEWLREQLGEEAQGVLAELMLADPGSTLQTVKLILGYLSEHEVVRANDVTPVADAIAAFKVAATGFASTLNNASFKEEASVADAAAFSEMAQALDNWDAGTAAGLVGILQSKAAEVLCTQSGSFKAFKKKGAWEAAAKLAGKSKAEGTQLFDVVAAARETCCETWAALLASTSSRVLQELLPVLQPAMERIKEYKRDAALMDFNDLIRAARNLLRGHPAVRAALAAKYRHVLVDEFQDTDPAQTEIFWRLCGDAPEGADDSNWRAFLIRPGALFLVGDPKQAIYRFRGADVRAYVEAREALRVQEPASILSISVNFRSCSPILQHVNERFEAPLSRPEQPGFIHLTPFRPERESGPCVAAIDVQVAGEDGKANAEAVRDGEADAVARLCAYLVGNELIDDPDTGERRLCRPGDIALLAPTGAQLWRYEQALENCGLPVATQAGKGFFKRQEVQDLIALTRVLADNRDSLALGSLLRGPLVGLTDEEILDILWSLRDGQTNAPARLSLSMDEARIEHALARETIQKLQSLRRRARSTTPHSLLSQAIAELRVRAILAQRSGRQAERSLANIDAYLSLSRAYDVRGIGAFSDAMRSAWEDESRAVEGRPDAHEESVALFSMHAAKGLEWPIVIPINGATTVKASSSAVVSRATSTLYCAMLGVAPVGHEDAMEAEKAELERERVRLWYVAATRARELLVIPRLDVPMPANAWGALVDLGTTALPTIEVPEAGGPSTVQAVDEGNLQTPELFREEANRVAAASRPMTWLVPSREEDATKALVVEESSEIFVAAEGGAAVEMLETPAVQGGRDRGLILHKLLEEVLSGETSEDTESLTQRAGELSTMLGHDPVPSAEAALSPAELADTTRRVLALAVVQAARPRLLPEFHVYASHEVDGIEKVRTGVVDAIAYDQDGKPEAVFDWKSDVEPHAGTLKHYVAQVRSYLDMTGTPKGYVVFASTGAVHEVLPAS